MALIDQDATIRALVQLHEETGVKTAQAIRVVREMPEADVVEHKKGKWISRKNELKNKDWWTCSECQGRFDYEWKFCPNCGADMREESDNG